MQRLTVVLIFLLVLTACSAPSTPAPTLKEINAPESEPETVQGTFETSLLVTQWKGGANETVLLPLDPATGKPLPDYTPISLGQTAFHAFSPDRRTLAVVTYPNQSAYNGSLLLIDLSAWTSRRFELKLSGWVSTMVFSPNGQQLAIAHGESNFKLSLVKVEEGVIEAQTATDSIVTRLKFTENGEGLMLYRPTVDPSDRWKAGPPQIELLDAADLTRHWSAALENVHDGVYPRNEDVDSTNIYQPGQAFYISPGLTFAPDRDALYIVHADSERLTTVEFNSQRVETFEIEEKLSWFEQLLARTAGVAYAKIGDGITRQAVVSPDGQFLYVVGVNSVTHIDQQGSWQMEQTPLGLEVIDTSDGSRVDRIETDTTELSLSPDGSLLYLRNWGNNQDNIPWTEIYDLSTQKILARKEKIFANPVFLMNGEFLLASTYSTGETSHHMSLLQPDGSSVLAEWTDASYVYWLTTP